MCKRGGGIATNPTLRAGFSIGSALDLSLEIFSHPRLQGSMQAFVGLAEAGAGGLATLSSGGLVAPIGWPVLVHGLDQFVAGISTVITGRHSVTLTEQLLQTTGMPSEWASFTNDVLSIGGTMGGSAIIRASKIRAFTSYRLPPMLHHERTITTLTNPKVSKPWANSINPFKGKTFQEIDQLLRAKGFTTKGPNPSHGKGSYFSPIANRKYYLDYAGKTYKDGITELPHVDVHYNIPINGIEKQRFPIGEYLYEFK